MHQGRDSQQWISSGIKLPVVCELFGCIIATACWSAWCIAHSPSASFTVGFRPSSSNGKDPFTSPDQVSVLLHQLRKTWIFEVKAVRFPDKFWGLLQNIQAAFYVCESSCSLLHTSWSWPVPATLCIQVVNLCDNSLRPTSYYSLK